MPNQLPPTEPEGKPSPLSEAAPAMLEALEFVLAHTSAQNQFAPTMSMHEAAKAWNAFLKLARKAVKQAKA